MFQSSSQRCYNNNMFYYYPHMREKESAMPSAVDDVFGVTFYDFPIIFFALALYDNFEVPAGSTHRQVTNRMEIFVRL